MSIEMIEAEEFNQGTQIKVIGVGGGGSNAVEHMIARSVQGVEFVCANTDAQALTRSSAHRIIQLGGSGLGAGSKPDKAVMPQKRPWKTSAPPLMARTCCSSPQVWVAARARAQRL